MPVSWQELNQCAAGRGAKITHTSDTRYSLPASRFVAGPFASGLASFYSAIGFVGYLPDALDCDDYALACSLYMRVLHARTGVHSGIAFGDFRYVKGSERHAICAYFTMEGGQIKLRFFEPQTRKPEELTKEEVVSCFAFNL